MAGKKFNLAGVVRNRIVERKMLKPGDLLDHPIQWRTHSDAQAAAAAGVLLEVGIADTLKAWYSERADGALVTWDGHLRKSLDPDLEWPVDILDITDAEADYLLATHDPLGAMAGADNAMLSELLRQVNSGDAAVQALLAGTNHMGPLYLTFQIDDGQTTVEPETPALGLDRLLSLCAAQIAGERTPEEIVERAARVLELATERT